MMVPTPANNPDAPPITTICTVERNWVRVRSLMRTPRTHHRANFRFQSFALVKTLAQTRPPTTIARSTKSGPKTFQTKSRMSSTHLICQISGVIRHRGLASPTALSSKEIVEMVSQ